MEKYTDTDIINDVIDYLSKMPHAPILSVLETDTNTFHDGMRYFSSSTEIKGEHPCPKMVRTLQIKNLDGFEVIVDVRHIKELDVYWDHTKYKVPDQFLDDVVNYPAPFADGGTIALTNAGMQAAAMKKPKVQFTAPPQRKVTWK